MEATWCLNWTWALGTGMKVAVIAFGTRGDVQPLVILAAGLVSRCTWCSDVVLVSHKQHSALVRSVLDVSVHPHHSATFAAVDSPLVIWKGQLALLIDDNVKRWV